VERFHQLIGKSHDSDQVVSVFRVVMDGDSTKNWGRKVPLLPKPPSNLCMGDVKSIKFTLCDLVVGIIRGSIEHGEILVRKEMQEDEAAYIVQQPGAVGSLLIYLEMCSIRGNTLRQESDSVVMEPDSFQGTGEVGRRRRSGPGLFGLLDNGSDGIQAEQENGLSHRDNRAAETVPGGIDYL
jgi:hypothetical protein